MRLSQSILPAVALAIAVGGGAALAQQAAAPADPIETALRAAKTFAGLDHTGTLAALCVLPATGPGADTLPAYLAGAAPARSTWYADPAKVFDNLYFVGGSIHSAWALNTSDGIILINTVYSYNSEELIVGGMTKLGLDPKLVKYVIITHGHGDHVGGAKLMQDRFGAKIVMGAADWDFIEQSKERFGTADNSIKPRRDVVATDGMKVTLGDTSVTLIATPGHTQGAFSLSFEVKDQGRPLMVAYSGGTAFNFVNTIANFQTYIESQRRMAEVAERTKATVIMTNHSAYDNAVGKAQMVPGRKAGQPHPFEVGQDAVTRYFKTMEGCARVAQLKLEMAAKAN